MKRNISDIAAMGGVPTHALVTVALKPVDRKWLDAFHKGLRDCAAEYGVSIIGGDISALNAPGQACSLSILGRCRKDALCLRANAKEGDALFSTGFFGNSFASEKHLDFTPRLKEAKFLAGRFTRAMIDVSDGLLKDARRMAQASGLGLELDIERVARAPGSSLQAALSDGEDYELLLAVEAKRSEELERLWPFEGPVLTRLGSFVAAPPGTLRGIDGGTICESNCGFDHFHEKDAD
jgi:thiamine-monophosphate kinase